ncbi:MAG TPA: hypothetical protein VFE46_00075 [Pirellulales bacterium]|jgi:hypothetical protein|nr:hypothetical protein [Pirellulales bacterium]
MLPNWTIVGFTGHRKLSDTQVISDAIRSALDQLQNSGRLLATVSSAASGADTLFLEEVVRRKLPYFLVLPFSLARFQEDFEAAQWARVESIVNTALCIEEVHGADSPEEAYLEAGIRTVERSDVILAVWDGQPAAGIGGTAEVVEYARSLGKPLVLIDPDAGNIIEERLDQLPTFLQTPPWDPSQPRETVLQEFNQLNRQADLGAPQARQFVVYIIALNLLASGCGIFMSILHLEGPLNDIFNVSKFAALGGALAIAFYHRRAQWIWIRSRIGAEICRSFLALWNLRRSSTSLPRITVLGHDDLFRSLQLLWLLDASAALPLQQARLSYQQERIAVQLEYFKQNYQSAENWSWALKGGANVATLLAIFFGLLSVIFSEAGGPTWSTLATRLLSVLLPLAPPILLSALAIQDMPRRAERNRIMTAKLEDAAKRLNNTKTWPSLSRVVIGTEELLLQEVFEWHSVRRFAGSR